MIVRRSVVALALVTLWSAAAHAAEQERTVSIIDADGTARAKETAPAPIRAAAPSETPFVPVGAGVTLWVRNTPTPIVETAGLSLEAGVASGTSLNAPQEVALSELESDGTPLWHSAGSNYRTACAAHADVIAGADATGNDVVVRAWTSASATPLWSHTIKDANLASGTTVAVSDDGSTIAVLATLGTGGARMLLFDPASSTPIASYDATDSTTGRAIVVTSDGRYAAFRVSSWAYVYDRDANALREGFDTGASTDAIAVSDDAEYLAFGFTNVTVRRWNGLTYAAHWSRNPGSSILRGCAISGDGLTVATAWSDFGAGNPFVEIHDIASNVPNWTHDYPATSGSYQDIPSAIDITVDGAYLAVGSWGNEPNTSPQIHLFERASSTPLMAVITPGSMYDVNVADAGGGTVYVSAGGKHVHANQFGSGGDVVALRYGPAPSCLGDVDDSGAVDFLDLLAVLSAWGPCVGCPEDTDGNDAVDFLDLLNVLAAWGPC